MFLQMWELVSKSRAEYASFLPNVPEAIEAAPDARSVGLPAVPPTQIKGLVAPFDDTPFDDISLGSDCYQHLMQAATRSVDIFTPYLVLSDSMVDQLAARSFYLYQECAVWMYDSPALAELRRDVEATLVVSRLVFMEDLTDTNVVKKLLQAVLRVFAPLM